MVQRGNLEDTVGIALNFLIPENGMPSIVSDSPFPVVAVVDHFKPVVGWERDVNCRGVVGLCHQVEGGSNWLDVRTFSSFKLFVVAVSAVETGVSQLVLWQTLPLSVTVFLI